MYCGACARDATLVRGLASRGHEARLVPLYTPLKMDGHPPPTSSMFYGGVRVYLRQISRFSSLIPHGVLRLLDRPGLLSWISRFAISIDPASLGPMTVSVLEGSKGRQREELAQLVEYLGKQYRPDVVNLTNSMLSAIAPELKAHMNVPVVCTLQGEDNFIESLTQPFRSQAVELIRKNAEAIDRFVAPCDACAIAMQKFLAVGPDRIGIVRSGIENELYQGRQPSPAGRFTIGFLSSIRPEKGLDLLIEAMRLLAKKGQDQITLAIAGRVIDKRYWHEVRRKIAKAGLSEKVRYEGELDLAGKIRFLHKCDAFVLPSRIMEWRGIAVMEAMAAGLPVIVPDNGVFPELIGDIGIKVPLANPTVLADAVERLSADSGMAEQMGQQGARRIVEWYSAERMVDEVLQEYWRLMPSGVSM